MPKNMIIFNTVLNLFKFLGVFTLSSFIATYKIGKKVPISKYNIVNLYSNEYFMSINKSKLNGKAQITEAKYLVLFLPTKIGKVFIFNA